MLSHETTTWTNRSLNSDKEWRAEKKTNTVLHFGDSLIFFFSKKKKKKTEGVAEHIKRNAYMTNNERNKGEKQRGERR
jgi:hypothetical protein